MERQRLDNLLSEIDSLLDDGEPALAEKKLKRALRDNPQEWELWVALGEALSVRSLHSRAIKAFEKAAENGGGLQLRVLSGLAHAAMQSGNTGKAQAAVEAALAVDRDDAECNYFRAILYEMDARDDVAAFFYSRASKLEPERYARPLGVAEDEFRRCIVEALARLDEVFSAALDGYRLRFRDFPSRRMRNGRCGMLCESEVQRGRPGEKTPARPVLYLFRKNLLRGAADRGELVDRINLCLREELLLHSEI